MGEMLIGALLFFLGMMAGAGVLLLVAYARDGGE